MQTLRGRPESSGLVAGRMVALAADRDASAILARRPRLAPDLGGEHPGAQASYSTPVRRPIVSRFPSRLT